MPRWRTCRTASPRSTCFSRLTFLGYLIRLTGLSQERYARYSPVISRPNYWHWRRGGGCTPEDMPSMPAQNAFRWDLPPVRVPKLGKDQNDEKALPIMETTTDLINDFVVRVIDEIGKDAAAKKQKAPIASLRSEVAMDGETG